MFRSPTLFLLIIAVVSFLLICSCTLADADTVITPLCAEVRGFAGEYNDHLVIPVTEAVTSDSPIILAAHAFPDFLDETVQKWLEITADYSVEAGAKSTLSGQNGVLKLSSVAANTNIEVRIKRLRVDGPAPFRFFSFRANKPTCFIDVSPHNCFIAPVPSGGMTVYFKTTPTSGYTSAKVNIVDDGEKTAGTIFVLSRDRQSWEEHSDGAVIANVPIVEFTYTSPSGSAPAYHLLHVGITWGTEDHSSTPTGKKGAESSTPGPVPTSSTSPTAAPHKAKSGWSGLSVFLVILCLAAVTYMAVGSYYNYTTLGMTEFPDMIPHIAIFIGCGRFLQLCFARCMRRSGSHVEYDSINGDDNPYRT